MDRNLVSKIPKPNINTKKSLKKILKKNYEKHFLIFFLFLKVIKVQRPGRKTSGFQTVRILKICRTFGPDVMSGRALPGIRFFTIFALQTFKGLVQLCPNLYRGWGFLTST